MSWRAVEPWSLWIPCLPLHFVQVMRSRDAEPISVGRHDYTAGGVDRRLTGNRINWTDVLVMIKRGAKVAYLPVTTYYHTFRPTATTIYVLNGDEVEKARRWPFTSYPRPYASLTG